MGENEYLRDLKAQAREAKTIIVESPSEIVHDIMGLELWEFEVFTGDDAHCANEEIYMCFQGKEMRIYIDNDGKLCVYTD
jgi:hypothetical protein